MATVRYMVDDIEACVAFYNELLGFSVEQRMGPMVILARDDLRLWLAGPGTSASRPMPDGQTPKPGGWNRIVIAVDDLDTVAAALRASGSTFRNDIISGPGGRQILAEDPSGNLIELFEARRS
ncbi:MAG: VOC family protein [Chloroflexota bacterium]|nr:VOC family protein [Chloroflexota bacterium]